MGLELQPIACESYINKGFMVKELLKNAQKIVLVVIPTKTILLGLQLLLLPLGLII